MSNSTMSISEWTVDFPDHLPDHEGHREALCTLGNGLFATRGAAEESTADGHHYPGTYIAGIYDTQASEVAGETVFNEDLVNLPNWLPITFRPEGGQWMNLHEVEILDWRRTLDIREGLLHRTIRVKDSRGRVTRVDSTRMVHMGDPHMAGLSYRMTAENWSGRIEVLSSIDGSVQNLGVARYRQLASKHLRVIERGPIAPEGIYLLAETLQSRVCVSVSARTRLFRGGEALPIDGHLVETDETIGQQLVTDISEGETIEAQKIVSMYATRDPGTLAPDVASRLAVEWAPDLDDLLVTHKAAWESLWGRFDLKLITKADCPDGDRIQQILRLHIFHLLVTISENTTRLDVGVPARGLHGEAYRGHVFWDELYVFPFYDLRVPDITRSLLLYRYHRLDAAHALARENEVRGAVFPWQSGSDGREVTQRMHLNPMTGTWKPDHSRLQRHVNLAIVYNVWQYWQVSADRRFLERYAAEMVLDIMRALADLTHFNEESGRYEIHGVMGPDEYHEKYPDAVEGGLRNNAYTNVMVVWGLERALEILDIIRPARRKDLLARLRIDEEELDRWRDITKRMKVPFHGDRVISQFEGWEDLEELDWEKYRKKYGTVLRLDRILRAEGDTPDRYKASKQADVTMLFYLLPREDLRAIFEQLGYEFDEEMVERNVGYYLPRSSHGSTLDLVVHAAVVDLVDRNMGWELFGMALRADVEDIQGGTTAEGIHMGAMAGTVDIVLRHYAGIDVTSDVLSVSPRLPDVLDGLKAKVHHHGVWVDLDVRPEWVHLSVERGAPRAITVEAWDKRHELTAGSELWIHHPETGVSDQKRADPEAQPRPA